MPLSDWANVDLESELETLLDIPVILINNATTGAIGEAFHGAGLRYQTFGYLSFNFGFGGGIVINGEPFFGAFGNAGKLVEFIRMKKCHVVLRLDNYSIYWRLMD
ncbi:ROK family protein [Vibrio sp. PP-XX7]